MENSVQQRESAATLKMMVQAPESLALNPKRSVAVTAAKGEQTNYSSSHSCRFRQLSE